MNITSPQARDAVMAVVARRWAFLAVNLCGFVAEVSSPYDGYNPHGCRDAQQRKDDAECNALAKAIEEMTGYPTPPIQVADFLARDVDDKLRYSHVGAGQECQRLRRIICDRAKVAEDLDDR